jgi:hypothetical protein
VCDGRGVRPTGLEPGTRPARPRVRPAPRPPSRWSWRRADRSKARHCAGGVPGQAPPRPPTGSSQLGHFAAARWHVAGQRRAEVLVSGEGLGRGAVDVLGTLLHEAAHGLADTRGVKDTSRQGRYHNRNYARLAAELGLEVARDARIGWSQTTVGDQLAAAYPDVLAELAAALGLWRYAEQQLPTSAGSRNLLACACPCGRKLRVAKQTLEQAPILCGACDEPFEPCLTA